MPGCAESSFEHKLCGERVSIDDIKPKTYPAFEKAQLRLFADAALDPNLIHLDDTFAKDAGFPSVIVHGMLSMSVMGNYLATTFPEDQWTITKFSSRFKKVTFPGDVPTCHAEVKSNEGTLVLNVWVENQKGEVTVDGAAELVKKLP